MAEVDRYRHVFVLLGRMGGDRVTVQNLVVLKVPIAQLLCFHLIVVH